MSTSLVPTPLKTKVRFLLPLRITRTALSWRRTSQNLSGKSSRRQKNNDWNLRAHRWSRNPCAKRLQSWFL